MLVTNKERMAQIASALESSLNLIRDELSRRNMLEEPISPNVQNVTIGNILHNMRESIAIVAGTSENTPKYWANVTVPYNEDTFPVEH